MIKIQEENYLRVVDLLSKCHDVLKASKGGYKIQIVSNSNNDGCYVTKFTIDDKNRVVKLG